MLEGRRRGCRDESYTARAASFEATRAPDVLGSRARGLAKDVIVVQSFVRTNRVLFLLADLSSNEIVVGFEESIF